MALKNEELQAIGEYVQSHLAEWLPNQVQNPVNFTYPIELTERMIRVEEELKNQRELMKQGFEQNDKQFHQVNTRLENIETKMFHFMIWSSGFTATVAGIVIGIIKFT